MSCGEKTLHYIISNVAEKDEAFLDQKSTHQVGQLPHVIIAFLNTFEQVSELRWFDGI